jgi:hypothetical protein
MACREPFGRNLEGRRRRPRLPFTFPAASAKTVGGGLASLHVLYLRPSWPLRVMWASQDAKLQTDRRRVGSNGLGSLCCVATGCRGSRSVKGSDGAAGLAHGIAATTVDRTHFLDPAESGEGLPVLNLAARSGYSWATTWGLHNPSRWAWHTAC